MLEDSDIGPTPGIVKSEADAVLDTLHAQVDWAEGGQKLIFQGQELASDEIARRERELAELAKAVNARLAGIGVRLIGCWPELMGLGARFKGIDAEGRDYDVDFHLEDEARVAGEPFSRQLAGLHTVQLIEQAIRERRAEYLDAERLERLGLVVGKV